MNAYCYYPMGRNLRRRMMEHMAGHAWEDVDFRFPIDVISTPEGYEISAMLPGVKSEDFDVEIVEDTLTISGEYKVEKDEKANYLLKERPEGKFKRSIQLPAVLEVNNAQAVMENGILKITVQKSEEAKPKTIKVTVK
jgi:HSP20 family protein